jgi:hypothetical protein
MSDDTMLQEHKKSYQGFVRLVAVSTLLTALGLVFLAFLLL